MGIIYRDCFKRNGRTYLSVVYDSGKEFVVIPALDLMSVEDIEESPEGQDAHIAFADNEPFMTFKGFLPTFNLSNVNCAVVRAPMPDSKRKYRAFRIRIKYDESNRDEREQMAIDMLLNCNMSGRPIYKKENTK